MRVESWTLVRLDMVWCSEAGGFSLKRFAESLVVNHDGKDCKS